MLSLPSRLTLQRVPKSATAVSRTALETSPASLARASNFSASKCLLHAGRGGARRSVRANGVSVSVKSKGSDSREGRGVASLETHSPSTSCACFASRDSSVMEQATFSACATASVADAAAPIAVLSVSWLCRLERQQSQFIGFCALLELLSTEFSHNRKAVGPAAAGDSDRIERLSTVDLK